VMEKAALRVASPLGPRRFPFRAARIPISSPMDSHIERGVG